jgi:hypothetical protein
MSAPSDKRRNETAPFWWFLAGVNALGTLHFAVNGETGPALFVAASGIACVVCALKDW